MKNPERPIFWASLAAFLLLSAVAGAGLMLPFDLAMMELSSSFASRSLDRVGTLFSTLGSLEVSSAVFALLVLVVLLRGDRRLAGRLVVVFLVASAIEVSMKLFLPVPPIPANAVRGQDVAPFVDVAFPYPYPSGHALRTTLLLGALCLARRTTPVWVVSLAVLLVMGVTRVYLGVHWASDVIGGTLLGVAGLAWAYGGRSPRWR